MVFNDMHVVHSMTPSPVQEASFTGDYGSKPADYGPKSACGYGPLRSGPLDSPVFGEESGHGTVEHFARVLDVVHDVLGPVHELSQFVTG